MVYHRQYTHTQLGNPKNLQYCIAGKFGWEILSKFTHLVKMFGK